MEYIVVIFANLVVGIAAGYTDNGSILAAHSELTSGTLSRIDSSHNLDYTTVPKFGTKVLSHLQNMKSVSRHNESQNRLREHILPRSTAVKSLMDEEFQTLLMTRTIRKSATSPPEASSESWSGASVGAKRKVDQQLLQHDLAWGQSKAPVEPSGATASPKLRQFGQSGLSNKKLKPSARGLFDGSKGASSKSMTKSSSRIQSSNEARGQASGSKQTQADSGGKKLPGGGSRTTDQRAQRNRRQQELREEQKRKIQSGDPEAINERAKMNARRRELEHERRARIGDPIKPVKTSEEKRAAGRMKTAKYRARKRGELEPEARTYKTPPEQRTKWRDRMRKRRAQAKSLALGNEKLSPPTTIQKNNRQRKRLEQLESSSSSESEWKSSGRSDKADPSISSENFSEEQTDRDGRHSLLSLPQPTVTRSRTTTRRGSASAGKKERESTEGGAKVIEKQQTEHKPDSRNNPELTSAASQKQKNAGRNSPTDSGQPVQEWPVQQSHLPSPLHSPILLQGLTQPPLPERLQDIWPEALRIPSPGRLQDPLPGIPQNQATRPTIAQEMHDLWRQPPLHMTPPMSPLSLGSAPSLDLTRPSSPNLRNP